MNRKIKNRERAKIRDPSFFAFFSHFLKNERKRQKNLNKITISFQILIVFLLL